jgi:hypothetical protein
MLASDDGDVRAYFVATLGWLKCVVLEPRGEDALHVDEYEGISSLMSAPSHNATRVCRDVGLGVEHRSLARSQSGLSGSRPHCRVLPIA